MTYQQELGATGAKVDTELAALGSQVTNLSAKVAEQAGVISARDAELAVKDRTIATLLERIAELEAGTPATLFGVTVNGGVRKNMPDLHDNVQVSRVFAAGTENWANEDQHKQFPNSKWACSNSYQLSEAKLPAMLASIPDADKAKIVGWADGHELEHPDKNLRAADVKARVKRTAPIIRDAGLTVVWCMMGYSLRNDDWLNWVDPDDVDLLAFDKYNSANKKNPPAYQDVDSMVEKAVAASERFGKPWAFWETGTNNFGDQATRVAWAKGLKAKMIEKGALHGIWFDRASTTGSSWDGTLDRPTAEAWLLS